MFVSRFALHDLRAPMAIAKFRAKLFKLFYQLPRRGKCLPNKEFYKGRGYVYPSTWTMLGVQYEQVPNSFPLSRMNWDLCL